MIGVLKIDVNVLVLQQTFHYLRVAIVTGAQAEAMASSCTTTFAEARASDAAALLALV